MNHSEQIVEDTRTDQIVEDMQTEAIDEDMSCKKKVITRSDTNEDMNEAEQRGDDIRTEPIVKDSKTEPIVEDTRSEPIVEDTRTEQIVKGNNGQDMNVQETPPCRILFGIFERGGNEETSPLVWIAPRKRKLEVMQELPSPQNGHCRRSKRKTPSELEKKEIEYIKSKLLIQDDRELGLKEVNFPEKGKGVVTTRGFKKSE